MKYKPALLKFAKHGNRDKTQGHFCGAVITIDKKQFKSTLVAKSMQCQIPSES